MSFDLKAAQEICNSIKGQNPEDGNYITHAFYKAAWDLLPAALDEVERLQKALALKTEQHKGQAYVIGSYLGMLTDFNELNESQAKRIAELEADNPKWREYNLQLDRKNRKLLAAIKKLGQAKRERGKALVEERAQWNAICRDVGADPSDRYCTGEGEDGYPDAREQLRREGKL